MSRFYEALKQASRSLHTGREGEELDDPDFPAILNQPVESDQSEMAGLPAEEPLVDSREQFAPKAAIRQEESFGIEAEADLDGNAPLIPNAVDPAVLEHYRLLRTKIMHLQSEKQFRSLLVSSAESKEGKTVTVLNLALAFSMLPSYKVLVVDGDIRKGQASEWLGIDGQPGLGNLLEGTSKLEEVVLKSGDIPFQFMGRGNSRLSPPELLHSGRWANHVRKISQHFDLVLIDSPPVSLVADAQLLAAGSDAVLLVARAFYTSAAALKKMSQDFRRFRVIGTVLNGGESLGGYRRYRSYYPTKP